MLIPACMQLMSCCLRGVNIMQVNTSRHGGAGVLQFTNMSKAGSIQHAASAAAAAAAAEEQLLAVRAFLQRQLHSRYTASQTP
jgi:hypothetical protein